MFGVIFDMDGTLVDSGPLIWESLLFAASRHGFDLSTEDYREVAGRSLFDCIPAWEKKFNITVDVQAFRNAVNGYQLDSLNKEGLVMPGIWDFLPKLKKNNIPIAVGTASGAERAYHFLETTRLLPHFDVVVTGDDITRSKPFPDIFLLAAQKLSVPPSRCVVIEDALPGIQAGAAAGMRTVGYAPKPEHKRELVGADALISDFSELSIEKLTQLLKK